MNKITILGITLFAIHATSAQEINPTAPNDYLKYYSGDFTDTDGDGMSDVAEKRYGYNPTDDTSFPTVDFLAGPKPEVVYVPMVPEVIEGLKIRVYEEGIDMVWDLEKYRLILNNGEQSVFYGGHGGLNADVNYPTFELKGNEVLRGAFREHDPQTYQSIRETEWFEIDLSDYPLPPKPPVDLDLGSPDDKISFRFQNFDPELKDRYVEFLRKLMPILNDVLGHPAETFVCTIVDQGFEAGSWMSTDHGRTILADNSLPHRLFVHELIHAWKGKYAFTNTVGEDWGYSPMLSGFEETAEGLAYEILHDYIEAYPNDDLSTSIIEWGSWNNWSSRASNYDVVKHQRFTGGGDFWTDPDSRVDRYNIAAMTIQTIQKHDEDFFKKMMSLYYDKIESDPNWKPNREDLVDLWASVVPYVNGIDTRTYLNATPLYNGKKLEGFYPIIVQRPETTGGEQVVYGSYADGGGYLWWENVREENFDEHNIPDWVGRFLHSGGSYVIDVQDQPFRVDVTNIKGESVLSYTGMSDDWKWPDGQPGTMGNLVLRELDPERFPTGLYKQRLEFTNYTQYTDKSSDGPFYFFGYEGFRQNTDEYVIFVGIDSQVADGVSIQLGDEIYTTNVENGCAIFRSLGIPRNMEGKFTIHVTGGGKTNVYQRTLINAGSPTGDRQHQFLIIDEDFDGVEDLYDLDIGEPVEEEPVEEEPVEVPSDPPTLTNDWDSATDLVDEWKYVDWFGYYYDHNNTGWIFEENLGWMFRMSFSFDSVWFWTEQLGWIWTNQETYSYVYSSTHGWIFLSSENKLYYDFALGGWFPWGM